MFNKRGIIAFAIAGILAIFLSSAVPVHSMGRAISIDIDEMVKDSDSFYVESQSPVLYLDFDISKHLDPWFDMYATQLALGVYEQLEEQARKDAAAMAYAARKESNGLALSMAIVGLLLLLFGFTFWFEGRKKFGV